MSSKSVKSIRAPRSVGAALRILVVENHADTRQSLDVFLISLGYRAYYAETIAGALALTGAKPYDVLLSDISLPDGDGWELLRTLCAEGRRPAHAIAMSGRSEPSDQARSRDAGFELHLAKPFAPEELARALSRASKNSVPPPPVPEPPQPADLNHALRQRLHDGLCQHIAAAALLQGALASQLETQASRHPRNRTGEWSELASEARHIGQVLSEALDETRRLMRDLNTEP